MKNLKLLFVLAIAAISISSCNKSIEEALSEEEIIEGLKQALKVGTDTATSRLSVTNGYFKDQAVKLLLPDEISNSLALFKSKTINLGVTEVTGEQLYTSGFTSGILGIDIKPLSGKEDDLILGINRAAETAAKDAGPIFWDAITGMSIADGNNILFGGIDTAATGYLNTNTRPSLFTKFEPKIDAALSSVKVGDKSVVAEYESFVGDYNTILNTGVGTETISSLMSINTVQADDLSAYSTTKGLNGLFSKVAIEEKKIRFNPLHRVTALLEKVFGELDK